MMESHERVWRRGSEAHQGSSTATGLAAVHRNRTVAPSFYSAVKQSATIVCKDNQEMGMQQVPEHGTHWYVSHMIFNLLLTNTPSFKSKMPYVSHASKFSNTFCCIAYKGEVYFQQQNIT
jgi:hypothetical protein